MNRLIRFTLLCLVPMTLLSPVSVRSQSARDQIAKEVDRITATIAAKPNTEEWRQATSDFTTGLENVRRALAANHLYSALEKLQEPWVNLSATEWREGKPEIVAKGMPGFEAEWKKADEGLRRLEQQYQRNGKNTVPMAVRALAEADAVASRRYYNSSLVYARAVTGQPSDSVKTGLDVLGTAYGFLEFANFCESLRFGDVSSGPAIGSVKAETDALEAENDRGV